MDIAKYIGLYLLKNNFCYIHGLGNLEIKKIPAVPNAEGLQSPKYEVVLTPTGSIDDNLANFIAINEQVSISKAANSLRDFSTEARAQLKEGKEVIIPAIGKFVEQNGRIKFISDPQMQYSPPSIPTLTISKRAEEEPNFKISSEEEAHNYNTGTVNWGKIALWLIGLAVIIGGVIAGVSYMRNYQSETTEVTTKDSVAATPATMTPVETASVKPVETTMNAGQMQYKVVLNNYNNLDKAQKRVTQLKGFGNNVELTTKDSINYMIVMPVSSLAADTTKIMDSLKRNFNPKGSVSIYR